MPGFNNYKFTPGRAVVTPGALKLRYAFQEVPGIRGVTLTSQGVHAREIEQCGVFFADTLDALLAKESAVEDMIDGELHELTDDHGRRWPETTMIRFEGKLPERQGPRWKLEYRITYLQVLP